MMLLLKCVLLIFLLIGIDTSSNMNKEIYEHSNWKLLNDKECGLSKVDQYRIVGGKSASLGQYPWIARLGYTIKGHEKELGIFFLCGGALISPMYVLSASHCMENENLTTLHIVRLGEHNVNTAIDCEDDECAPRFQDIRVKKVLSHEAYDTDQVLNDIALIRLKRPAKLNVYVNTVCLPKPEIFFSDEYYTSLKMAEVAGWGTNNITTETTAKILQFVKAPLVSLKRCAVGFHNPITANQICAGGTLGQDSCGGDSGGPLVITESVDGGVRSYLIGVVSYGSHDCGKFAKPAVYTKVTRYLKWILDNVKA